MTQAPYFTRFATLRARQATVRITLVIDEPILPAVSDIDDRESILKIHLRFDLEDAVTERSFNCSAWSDSVFDLLDVSLCLAHFAQRDDTTETLLDIHGGSDYTHRAQWELYQSLFDIGVLLSAKDTAKCKDKRFVRFILYHDEDCRDQSKIIYMVATPEAITQFAIELRTCYTELEAATLVR